MAKECRHIKPGGHRCHAVALRGMPYCSFHQKLHKAVNASKNAHRRLDLPSLEDPSGVQLAIIQVIDALSHARIDEREAGVLLYGLGIATQLTLKARERDPSQSIEDVCELSDGSLIAAEGLCQAPLDCRDCPIFNLCPEDRKQSRLIPSE